MCSDGVQAAAEPQQVDHALLGKVIGQVVALTNAGSARDQQRPLKGSIQGSSTFEGSTR